MFINIPTKYDQQIVLVKKAIARRECTISILAEEWRASDGCPCCFYDGNRRASDLSFRNDNAEKWLEILQFKADRFKLRVIKSRLKKL